MTKFITKEEYFQHIAKYFEFGDRIESCYGGISHYNSAGSIMSEFDYCYPEENKGKLIEY